MDMDAVETLEAEHKAIPTGKDELNFAEFPIALLSEVAPRGVRTLVFKDEIYDKGKKRLLKRKLTIEGSETYGLPTAKDDEVILAFIQLTKQRGFSSRLIEFTRFELISLLGWSNTGQSYARLELALRRWVSVTLHYENAWWDRSEERWTSGAFHIIDDFEINDSREQSKQLVLLSSRINWSDRVFKSFVDGNLRTIRYDVYVKLKHPTAKRMYRFLDKRFHQSGEWEFDLHDFAYEHIGLSRGYADCGKIKEKLNPGLIELEAIGFLEPMTREQRYNKSSKGRWRIHVHQKKAVPIKNPGLIEPTSPPAASVLTELLVDRGVTRSSAIELGETYPSETIQLKIEIFDWLKSREDKRISSNPGGYLVASIRKGYATPKGFMPAAERQKQDAARKERERLAIEAKRQKQEEDERDRVEREAVFRYWNSLSPEQQEVLQAKADAEASPEALSLEIGPFKKMGQTLRREAYIRRLLEAPEQP